MFKNSNLVISNFAKPIWNIVNSNLSPYYLGHMQNAKYFYVARDCLNGSILKFISSCSNLT
jgi:hypothetical protein